MTLSTSSIITASLQCAHRIYLHPLKYRSHNLLSHGWSGYFDDATLSGKMPIFQDELKYYALKYIFNADEFGLNYRMAPN